jgi:hypothetical protein
LRPRPLFTATIRGCINVRERPTAKRRERDERAKFETQNLKRFSMNTKDRIVL